MLQPILDPNISIWLAGAAFVTGYLIINQIALRCMFLLGTSFFLLYYATATDTPLWGAIYTSSAMGAANLIGLTMLLARRSRWAVPRGHRDLYASFAHLPPGDFRALMRRGQRYVTTQAEVLGTENEPVTRLAYVVSGRAQVSKRGENFDIPPGVFVGEVAYLLGSPSAATTTLPPGSEVVTWDVEDLARISARSPRFKLALEAAITFDMAAKVALAVSPGDMRHKPDPGFDSTATAQ